MSMGDELARSAAEKIRDSEGWEPNAWIGNVEEIIRSTFAPLEAENERLKFAQINYDGQVQHSAKLCKTIDRLRQRVAELERDIEKYRRTISVCSGSCSDHRGSIWDEVSGEVVQ